MAAANGSLIRPSYLSLDLGLCVAFRVSFVIADINHAILGADFFERFNIAIDMK